MADRVADGGATAGIVRKAWTVALPSANDHPDETWHAAGGDSLRAMHMMLDLERALGRPLPLDLMTFDMTMQDLADVLGRDVPAPTGSGPIVHLIPGAFGDEPQLADFRRGFGTALTFDVVELPDVGAPAAVLRDIKATGVRMAAAIGRRQAEGRLVIAGYSFGGAVAYEAAQCLQRSGRDVALVVVLDAFLGSGRPDWRKKGAARRLLRRLTGIVGRADPCRRLILAAADHLYGRQTLSVRWHFLANFRGHATDHWRPAPPRFPLMLVVSDEFAPTTLAEWRRLAPLLQLVQIPTRHKDILRQPTARSALLGAICSAVQNAHAI